MGWLTSKHRRRAQQILLENLSEGYQKYCPTSKAEARERVNHFRAIGRKRQKAKAPKPAFSWPIASYQGERRCANTYNHYALPNPLTAAPQVSILAESSSTAKVSRSSSVRDSINQTATRLSPNPSAPVPDHATILPDTNTDRQSLISSFSSASRIKQILRRRTSYSSSLASGLASILRQGFSTSTLETCSDSSNLLAEIPEENDDLTDSTTLARQAMEIHERKIKMHNTDVIRNCCAHNTDCVHRKIRDMILSSDHVVYTGIFACTYNKAISQDTLFFTAMSGAPADLIIAYARWSKVDMAAVNSDGQNFLYFLDLAGFRDDRCTCVLNEGPVPLSWHTSRFECLLYYLDLKSFDFVRVDYEGRSFLSYLCTSPYFDIRWILRMAVIEPRWTQRLQTLSFTRDSSGCFLINYLSLNPRYGELDECELSVLRPKWEFPTTIEYDYSKPLEGVLNDEVEEAPRISDNRFIVDTLYWVLPNNADINKYDCTGRTPLMRYLDEAVNRNLSEGDLVDIFRMLVNRGANIHARSRGGCTVLHFAARKGLPYVVDLCLSLGLQPSQADKKGLSALDYASRLYYRSINWRSSAESTARSLKVTALILPFMRKAKSQGKSSKPDKDGEEVFWQMMADNSLVSMSAMQNKRSSSPSAIQDRRHTSMSMMQPHGADSAEDFGSMNDFN